MRKLQTLGGMHGHKLYAVLAAGRVLAGKKRYVRKILLQRGFFAAFQLKIVHGLAQLGQVV